ncbi:hypothetical protein [Turneriella parva]|uniref:Lipoprotein n=1 Tax=Turneriella parva (strain ATCC BAA-1111 / DSM 21527 / NCTC 11395 / H) TaxID=869212 RepID=I4B9J1_TURPD|nr:hypothetical protein [Turneriella parva]AFM13948.1 hypothetical protein Turpa_3310 [Turneriella parva DSM 21527]
MKIRIALLFTLTCLSLARCGSYQVKKDAFQEKQPIVLSDKMGYIAFSYLGPTSGDPGRWLAHNTDKNEKISMYFSTELEPQLALFEVQPGNYSAIGLSGGRQLDFENPPVYAKLKNKWNVCAGCIAYIGQINYSFVSMPRQSTVYYKINNEFDTDSKELLKRFPEISRERLVNGLKNPLK